MQRLTSTPRPDWERIVEAQGLIYHHTANGVYWDESVCYQFTAREIDELEAATNELQARCLDAAQHVIDKNRFAEFGIPPAAVPAINVFPGAAASLPASHKRSISSQRSRTASPVDPLKT